MERIIAIVSIIIGAAALVSGTVELKWHAVLIGIMATYFGVTWLKSINN